MSSYIIQFNCLCPKHTWLGCEILCNRAKLFLPQPVQNTDYMTPRYVCTQYSNNSEQELQATRCLCFCARIELCSAAPSANIHGPLLSVRTHHGMSYRWCGCAVNYTAAWLLYMICGKLDCLLTADQINVLGMFVHNRSNMRDWSVKTVLWTVHLEEKMYLRLLVDRAPLWWVP